MLQVVKGRHEARNLGVTNRLKCFCVFECAMHVREWNVLPAASLRGECRRAFSVYGVHSLRQSLCVPNFYHFLEFYTQINLNYIQRFSLYSAVETHRLKWHLPLSSSPAKAQFSSA